VRLECRHPRGIRFARVAGYGFARAETIP
jgi:hypothetical protein